MKHRSDYRIVRVHKKGYYTYYQVQEKFLLFFWENCRAFDYIHQADKWISDQLVVETERLLNNE